MVMNLMRYSIWPMNQWNDQDSNWPQKHTPSPPLYTELWVFWSTERYWTKVTYFLIVNLIPLVLPKILSKPDFSRQAETVLLQLSICFNYVPTKDKFYSLFPLSKKQHGQNFAAEEVAIFILPCNKQVPWTSINSLWWKNFQEKYFKASISQQFTATSQTRNCDISLLAH